MAIAKISRPRSARSTVRYLCEPVDHAGRQRDLVSVVASTIGREPDMAIEFLGLVAKLRPRLKRHLYHVSISVPASERDLSKQEWAELGRAWCGEMGLQNYMIVLHDKHIHIVASRIRLDGTAAPDNFNFSRSEAVLRRLETRFNLLPTRSSHLSDPCKAATHRRRRSLAELHAVAEEGSSDKDFIRTAVDGALSVAPDETQMREALATDDIDMTMHKSPGGAAYILFSFRGRRYGPRALGRGYSLSHLVERGLQVHSQQEPPAQFPRPTWSDGKVPETTRPRATGNHTTAVRHLRNLGRAAQEAVERFRGQGGADLSDPDLYRPGREDTDELP